MIDPDKYLHLTGATGLLGRSLVRDLSATGRPAALPLRGSQTPQSGARSDKILD